MPGGRCGLYPGLVRSGSEWDKVQATAAACSAVDHERDARGKKWGFPQHNTYCEWSSILAEEMGELAKELNELTFGRGDRDRMRAEAAQVAAVAISILVHDTLGAIIGPPDGPSVEEQAPDGCRAPEEADNAGHPDAVVGHPLLTEPEIAIMRAMGAKWVSRDDNVAVDLVWLWASEPASDDGDGCVTWRPSTAEKPIAAIQPELFPSVRPGAYVGRDTGWSD